MDMRKQEYSFTIAQSPIDTLEITGPTEVKAYVCVGLSCIISST